MGRHQCHVLLDPLKEEFLDTGGDARWLDGLQHVPKKLADLNEVNKLLAHRPWLLNKSHIEVSAAAGSPTLACACVSPEGCCLPVVTPLLTGRPCPWSERGMRAAGGCCLPVVTPLLTDRPSPRAERGVWAAGGVLSACVCDPSPHRPSLSLD